MLNIYEKEAKYCSLVLNKVKRVSFKAHFRLGFCLVTLTYP